MSYIVNINYNIPIENITKCLNNITLDIKNIDLKDYEKHTHYKYFKHCLDIFKGCSLTKDSIINIDFDNNNIISLKYNIKQIHHKIRYFKHNYDTENLLEIYQPKTSKTEKNGCIYTLMVTENTLSHLLSFYTTVLHKIVELQFNSIEVIFSTIKYSIRFKNLFTKEQENIEYREKLTAYAISKKKKILKELMLYEKYIN